MISENPKYVPRRAKEGDAGYDIYAPHRMVLNCTQWQTFDLEFRFEEGDIPEGYVALVMPRSSTGSKHGLHLRNTVGVIDSGYRNNVLATLKVDGDEVVYEPGDRILQFVLVPFGIIRGEIPPEGKRDGGYGSTGA